MRGSLLSAAVALVLGGSTTYAVLADDLVPPGSKLELLYTRSAPIKGGLTEGVAAAPGRHDVLLGDPLRRGQGDDHAVRSRGRRRPPSSPRTATSRTA